MILSGYTFVVRFMSLSEAFANCDITSLLYSNVNLCYSGYGRISYNLLSKCTACAYDRFHTNKIRFTIINRTYTVEIQN